MRFSRAGRSAVGTAVPIVVLGLLAACAEPREGPPGSSITSVEITPAALMSSCGVSFTTETIEESGFEAYGVPPVNETEHICETWTGHDYQIQSTIIASNLPDLNEPDASTIVMYSSGYTYNHDASGNVQNVNEVGSTAFQMVEATYDEIQASYDNPYYGVYGGGGGGDPCIQPPCDFEMMRIGSPPRSGQIPPRARAGWAEPSSLRGAAMDRRVEENAKALRHNVKRKGVRFLVNSYDEVPSTFAGRRTFVKRNGASQRTLELDRATDLIVADEEVTPTEKVRAEHEWKKQGDIYVKSRTVVDVEEIGPDGRTRKLRTSIRISNVKVGGQP